MKKLGFFLATIAVAGVVLGQNTIGLPLIRNFGKTEFRGGAQTWDITQDASGRMLFANNEGMLTFDGTYWRLFPLPNKTIMRSLLTTADGRVYAGGQGELGYFAPSSRGTLKFYSMVGLVPANQRDFADVWKISKYGESIFFMTSDRIFEYRNQIIRSFEAPSEWVFMYADSTGAVVQDRVKGLFNFKDDKWMPVPNGGKLGSQIVRGAMLMADGLHLKTIQHTQFILANDSLIAIPANPTSSFPTGLTAATALNKDEYVIGTTGKGCVVLNKEGFVVQHLGRAEGMQDNNVICVFIDRDQNLWVGLNHGISMVAYNTPVKYIRPSNDNELSGYSSRIYDGKLYLATSNGAYQVPLSNIGGDLSFAKGSFSLIPNSQGQCYKLDEVNRQLLLAHNDGIFQLNQGQANRIHPEAAWLFLPLSDVIPASRVLVGNYFGVKLMQFRRGTFEAGPNLSGTRESFRFLAKDNQNRIWASHPYRGIYLLEIAGDSSSYSTKLFTAKDGLPSALGNHVFKIKNRVVFATERGAFEFDDAKKKFIPSPFLTPVIGNMPLRYLQEDPAGNVWFVSGKTLGVIEFGSNAKGSRNRITYFPELTGQLLSGFENIYPYNEENIFIGSEKGTILLNLAKYLQYTRRPEVVLSNVQAFGQADSTIFGGFFTASQSSNGKRTTESNMSLPFGFNNVHFEYSAPSYGLQENMQYSFQLEGYDNDWSAWTTRTEKDFTNLPNGTYTFKVKAHSNLGVESEPASFTFTIAPPWYKSPAAYFGYLLLLVLGIYSLYALQKRKLLIQQRKYEEKQEQLRIRHQLELEYNEKEIMRLRNEKLESEVMLKNRELADTTMHLVERSDALAKVKEELQKLYRNTGGNSDVKRAINLLNEIEKNNEDWDKFAASFDEINNDFLKKLKAQYPKLTNSDLKLCAYLQMKLTSKEIAQLLNISVRGVEISRYRLRKKLSIATEESLSDFLASVT